jgi:hypothetical protein
MLTGTKVLGEHRVGEECCMWRRVVAIVAGLTVCQVTMLVSLAVAFGLLMALASQPLLGVVAAGLVLAVPGLTGGAMAGFLADRHGGFYGAATALLFGEIIVLVKVLVAPLVNIPPTPFDLPIYLTLIALLGLGGAVGGLWGHRRRRLRPRARGAAEAVRLPAA